MDKSILKSTGRKLQKSAVFSIAAASGILLFSSAAFAGQSEANTAISRAEAKIEMATRQAGVAGNQGDQSYNMAVERLENSKMALSKGNYDTAEMLANESALLAELTGEKAKLAALMTSNAALSNTNPQ